MVSLLKPATPQVTSGGQTKTWVTDEAARDVLNELLAQLKIQNAHLALVTGEAINEEDLDGTN